MSSRRDVEQAVETLTSQQEACSRLGSSMYAELLGALAEDMVQDGPVRRAVGDLLASTPRSYAPALRLLGGLHRLVLDGSAPALAAFYPSVGGAWDLATAWPTVQEIVGAHTERLRAAFDQAPQTNEVGRSAALVGGLLRVADRFALPVRLVEIGASAGLNLRADHFRFGSPSGAWGPRDAHVVMDEAWAGLSPPVDAPLEVVERLGYDVAPLDVTRADDLLTLESYTWPDMTERLARLRAACEVATEVPAALHAASAADGLETLELVDGTATVVWHSVMWQYVAEDERDRITARLQALGEQAHTNRVFAHVTLEPVDDLKGRYPVVLTTWPFGEATMIGHAPPHGLPTTWTG